MVGIVEEAAAIVVDHQGVDLDGVYSLSFASYTKHAKGTSPH